MTTLSVLSALKEVSEYIKAEGKNISKTVLKRYVVQDISTLEEALAVGTKNGCIKRHHNEMYSFSKDLSIKEESYYDTVNSCITSLWKAEGHADKEFYVENTSRSDSKIIGPWTRPDFTLVSHKKFSWTVGYEFDVVTFEVKRPENCDVLAVFETLSHAGAATRAYVVFPVDPIEWATKEPAQEKRVRDECFRHGVGLIFISDPGNAANPSIAIKAVKRAIDHKKCSDFIDAVLSAPGKAQISEWKG